MKNRYYMLILASAVMALGNVAAFSQDKFDLSVRQAIFFTGTDTKSVDAAERAGAYSVPPSSPGNPGVPPNTFKLKTSQAVDSAGGICLFNLGVVVSRDAGKGMFDDKPYKTFGQVSNDGPCRFSGGGDIIFDYINNPKFETKVLIMVVKMQLGINKITFTIDPENKTVESDETNNSVSAYFEVIKDTYPIKKGRRAPLLTKRHNVKRDIV